jgi:tetratricopeptide (TPR) repeat protein
MPRSFDSVPPLSALGEASARQNDDTISLSRFAAVRGKIEYRLTQFDDASAAFSEAGKLADSVGESDLQLEALKGQGQVLYRIGHFDEAESVYVRARVLASDIDELAIADVDHQLAKVQYRREEYGAARVALESARRVRETAGDRPRDVAKTIHELGRVEHACRDLEKARSLYLEALRIERETGDLVTEQATLFQLGRLAIDEGDLDAAARYLATSKQLSQELGDPLWLVHAEFGDAFLAHARGDVAARALGEAALVNARALRIGLAYEIAAWLADLDSR